MSQPQTITAGPPVFFSRNQFLMHNPEKAEPHTRPYKNNEGIPVKTDTTENDTYNKQQDFNNVIIPEYEVYKPQNSAKHQIPS
jgi:hypothetical protein